MLMRGPAARFPESGEPMRKKISRRCRATCTEARRLLCESPGDARREDYPTKVTRVVNSNTNFFAIPAMPAPTPLPDWLRNHPAQWQAGTLDRDALHAQADELAQSAGHIERCRHLAREMLSVIDGLDVARQVVHDTPAYLLLVCAMTLQHRHRAGGPGITLTALGDLFARGEPDRRFAGESHLRAMLAQMQAMGLLEAAPQAGDRRVHRLQPTALLEDMFNLWVRAFLRVGTPDATRRWQGSALPATHWTYEVLDYRVTAWLEDGFVLNERFPLIREFMMHRHGYHVFLSLMEGLQVRGGEASAPLSMAALGERFEVARGTVRNTVRIAEDAGHLVFDSRLGVARLRPAFLALALRWMAMELTWMHGLAAAAGPAIAAASPNQGRQAA